MQQIPVGDQVPVSDGLDAPGAWLNESTAAGASASVQQKAVQLGTIEAAHLTLLRHWFQPTVVVVTLFLCMLFLREPGAPRYLALALVALLLSRQLFHPLDLRVSPSGEFTQPTLSPLIWDWARVIALLVTIGWPLEPAIHFPRRLILAWFAVTPLSALLASYIGVHIARQSRSAIRRHIIIGVNEVGLELARRAAQDACLGDFMGFFDFRSIDRLPPIPREQLAGHCAEVAAYVRRHAIDAIYIALPICNAPRIAQLLQELRDTTASVYFVPDIFAFDLVQARCVEINGMPAFSICDTPFSGMDALRKRVLDVVLATVALLLLWPALAALALAVRLSSPGPALFKQRRYGLNGEEFLVYKFRTMTVCEDGPIVRPATRLDRRITPIGRILRRTSLDELPQLINVLEGKMSFVGPRPHAVAHNDLYRKLIGGYMVRHKVRPGITGWAQVNGLRGEASAETMRQRVQYDLDYLRHWSLRLDIEIILRTALLMLRDPRAY
jgi:putative colanic acid biosynthesis UDP-glucose lipid carrier transferase